MISPKPSTGREKPELNMQEKKYLQIVSHYESCLAAHGDSHLGVDWPCPRDAETRYRVMLEVIEPEIPSPVTLLDFGCGASHLYEFIQRTNRTGIQYSGLDVSSCFIDLCQRKFPENTYFCLDVLDSVERLPGFDYVVMNGVFTEKRELTFDEMFSYVQKVLRAVFPLARRALAFNVMSAHVDWTRADLFHLPFDLLVPFLKRDLSRHFVIRNDYGLFEYTVYVYRQKE